MIERDWFDYVSAGGNIATLGALAYVFFKDYKTRKDVQDLTVLAMEMQEQNRLTKEQMRNAVKPDFALNGSGLTIGNELCIYVINNGHPAIIQAITFESKGLNLMNDSQFYNYRVTHNEKFTLKCSVKGSVNPDDVKFKISIYYKGMYQNVYELNLEGVGQNISTEQRFLPKTI